jgi:hypothetical protein
MKSPFPSTRIRVESLLCLALTQARWWQGQLEALSLIVSVPGAMGSSLTYPFRAPMGRVTASMAFSLEK